MNKDKTPMTTARAAEVLGCKQTDVYRYAARGDTKLVRAKVAGNAVLFETWSVDAEAERITGYH